MRAFSIGDAAADVRLGCGWTCAIDAQDVSVLEEVLDDLLTLPRAELCSEYGSLLSNVSVLENIVLPVVYHGRMTDAFELERGIEAAFAACGMAADDARDLCSRLPGELTPFEKRLAGFVRALVMGGEIIVYTRFFEGLTQQTMARAAALNDVFLERNPRGTAIFLGLSDMPAAGLRCDRHIEV